jgi:glycolate oxidase iron-sulfur subunit
MSGLRRCGERTLPAFHMVELLDASIRGLTAHELLSGKRSLQLPTFPAG